MSADRLTEAARVLRERAEAETILRDDDPYYEVTYMQDGTPITEMGAFERVLTPGVALALADWLDAVAGDYAIAKHGYWSVRATAVADQILEATS